MKNAVRHEHHTQHIGKVLIDVLRIVTDSLLVSIWDIKDDITENTQYHGIGPLYPAFEGNHKYKVADHDDDKKIDEEIQIDPDKLKIDQPVKGMQVLQYLSERNKAHYGKGK